MKRQKITDRNLYDYEDRRIIMQKSNGLCAHCGKKLTIGYNATVDHFVPLNKGGINQKINCVMLCEECNKRKSSRIISPEYWLPYLKDEERKALTDYFDSYIQSFEYMSRRNLFCCDVYVVPLYTGNKINAKNKKQKENIERKLSKKYSIIRAYPDDEPELVAFFTKYLKKIGQFGSEKAVEANIRFWLKFGCIYFIRNEEGNIEVMTPITLCYEKQADIVLLLNYIFSMKSNENMGFIINDLSRFIARRLLMEQDITYVRIKTIMFIKDKSHKYLAGGLYLPGERTWVIAYNVYSTNESYEEDENSRQKIRNLYDEFGNLHREMESFFRKPENQEVEYMKEAILLER